MENQIEILDEKTLEQTFRGFALESIENMVCDLIITNNSSAKQAVSMALQARKMKKAISDKKDELLEPLKSFQKHVTLNSSCLIKKLEKLEETLTEKIEAWIEEQNKSPFTHIEKIDVEDGSMNYKYDYEFKVENINEVPFKFLKVDEKAVNKALKSGMRSIPGLDIYETYYATFRVKNSENNAKKEEDYIIYQDGEE